MKEAFLLVKPVPVTSIGQVDRRRFPRSGPKVDDPRTIEIRHFKETLSLTTKEVAKALSKFEGVETKTETWQAYFQGYVNSDELIDQMVLRVRAYLAQQSPETKRFSDMPMVEIIEEWFKKLNINRGEAGCPWRKLGGIAKKDHSTLFRWYQENRKPRSIETIIAMNKTINTYLKENSGKSARH